MDNPPSIDRIKGIVFSLESMVNSAKKQLFGNQILLSQSELSQLITKLTTAIEELEVSKLTQPTQMQNESIHQQPIDPQEQNTLNSQKVAFKIKREANDYADGVLSRLQLLTTKLQTNIIKIESNINEGRKLIEQHQHQQNKTNDIHQE